MPRKRTARRWWWWWLVEGRAVAGMATVGDLKEAVREALDERGVTREIKAKLRAEVLRSLATTDAAAASAADAGEDGAGARRAQSTCDANIVINELVMEYLSFNKLRETASVFAPGATRPHDDPRPGTGIRRSPPAATARLAPGSAADVHPRHSRPSQRPGTSRAACRAPCSRAGSGWPRTRARRDCTPPPRARLIEAVPGDERARRRPLTTRPRTPTHRPLIYSVLALAERGRR